jgi:hypothetical protein
MSFRTKHEQKLHAAHAIVSEEDERAFAEEEIQPDTLAYVERIRARVEQALDTQDWDKVYQAHEMLANEISAIRAAMYSWSNNERPLCPEEC